MDLLHWAAQTYVVGVFVSVKCLWCPCQWEITEKADKLPVVKNLSDDNWHLWRIQMRALLISKDLWTVVDHPELVAEDKRELLSSKAASLMILSR